MSKIKCDISAPAKKIIINKLTCQKAKRLTWGMTLLLSSSPSVLLTWHLRALWETWIRGDKQFLRALGFIQTSSFKVGPVEVWWRHKGWEHNFYAALTQWEWLRALDRNGRDGEKVNEIFSAPTIIMAHWPRALTDCVSFPFGRHNHFAYTHSVLLPLLWKYYPLVQCCIYIFLSPLARFEYTQRVKWKGLKNNKTSSIFGWNSI